jgi:hypothetical protein
MRCFNFYLYQRRGIPYTVVLLTQSGARLFSAVKYAIVYENIMQNRLLLCLISLPIQGRLDEMPDVDMGQIISA